jgi:hypothetical protein
MLNAANQMVVQPKTSSAGPYDGDWSGTTDQGKPISFRIVNNAVAVFSIGYLTAVSSCQQNSSVTYNYNPPRPFSGTSFSIEEIHVPGLSVAAGGLFDSSTHAFGAAAFSFSQTSPTCISDGQASWEATRGQPSTPTPTPTRTPPGTPMPTSTRTPPPPTVTPPPTSSSPAAFVIPVAGSAPGSFGSFFRTGVQVLNTSGTGVAGRFIYHPAGVSGTASDPYLDFSIPSGATLSYADLVQTTGQTGLGSLDVVVPANGRVAIVTRVFNDAGAGGTSGFTEVAAGVCNSAPCPPGSGRSISVGPNGYLIAPADPSRFRFNIGVRTLELGAALHFDVYDASGRLVQSVNKAYGSNYFVLQTAEAFFGLPLAADYSVVITLTSGNAIVYGATIDNTTNDSSIQITGVLSPGFG